MRPTISWLFGMCALAVQTCWAGTDSGQPYGILIISRERLEVATSCEIGVYLQDQLVGRLFQEQATSFNLPPGPVSVALRQLPGQMPGCAPGMTEYKPVIVTLHAGQIQKFRIAASNAGLYLKAEPLEY